MLLGKMIIGLLWLMGKLPYGFAQRFGRMLGWLMYKQPNSARHIAKVNIALTMPELDGAAQQSMVKEALKHTAISGVEMGVMWGASPEKGRNLVRTVHRMDILQNALSSGRGMLLCVPHLGNWEVLNHFMTMHTSITAMYRPAKNATLDRWMLESREKTGIRLVPTTRAGVMALLETLENKGVVGILPDQVPKLQSGVFAPFMGVETLTAKLTHELVKRTRPVVVFAFAKRLEDGAGFDIHFIEADERLYSEDSREAACGLNDSIERCVRECPEQYQWTYKRFKRPPEGEPNPYKKAH